MLEDDSVTTTIVNPYPYCWERTLFLLIQISSSIRASSYQGQKAGLFFNNQTNPYFSQHRGLKHELRRDCCSRSKYRNYIKTSLSIHLIHQIRLCLQFEEQRSHLLCIVQLIPQWLWLLVDLHILLN